MKIEMESKLSDLQKAYRKFFRGKMKEWDVKSPKDLTPKKISDFFKEIKKDWKKEKASAMVSEAILKNRG